MVIRHQIYYYYNITRIGYTILFSFIFLTFVCMKISATLLLFYFSLLMVQPMLTMIHNGFAKEKVVCTMKCCQQKQPEKKQAHEASSGQAQKLPFGCCSNDMSNPFAQCCCCGGFIPEQSTNHITVLPVNNVIIDTYTGVLIPHYCSDCWRPPETAA